MKLFKCEDGFNVTIEPELLLLAPFNNHYVDRKGNENLVTKELAYIYFMHEVTSDFQTLEIEERKVDVKKHVNLDSSWQEDEFIKDCVDLFIERSETMMSGLLSSTYIMVRKIRAELEAINLSDKDKSGKPVYNLKQVIDSSKAIPLLMETLAKAENEYIKGQAEVNKNKGSKTKSSYEDM